MDAIITVDLGFGDSGKGATCDALTRRHNSNLVVRYSGGCQAGHNVELPDGSRHCFSQFGAGTLAGANTFLGPQVIINPFSMRQEAKHLHDVFKIGDPYDRLAVDPDCLVTTDIHVLKNRILEAFYNHGSCGQGIGATREYYLKYGYSAAITASDLVYDVDNLILKLQTLKERTLWELEKAVIHYDDQDTPFLLRDLQKLSPTILAREMFEVSEPIRLNKAPDPSWLQGTIIFEGAQGILLDQYAGFHPYTTWSDVTQEPALELCRQWGIEDVHVIGITRAYSTRHGNGPFVANPHRDGELTVSGADKGNEPNTQGVFRSGPLDMVMLRYALGAVGPNSIAVTCLDHLPERVEIIDEYTFNDRDMNGWTFPATPAWDIRGQQNLGNILYSVIPRFKYVNRADVLAEIKSFGIKISSTSNGPTYTNRTWID